LRKVSQPSCETSQPRRPANRTNGDFFKAIAGTPLAQDHSAFSIEFETRGVIMEGVLLQTVEGLGESLFPGELWELLQAEKEASPTKSPPTDHCVMTRQLSTSPNRGTRRTSICTDDIATYSRAGYAN
jgi:hypothetical protein